MILDEIVAKRKEQLARELQRTDRETMRKLALRTEREVYSFPDALKTGRLSIIAEVKKASPSKSVICADFHPVEQAAAYERAGADAISCLTEEHYFQGSSDYFRAIREAVSIPMLRKDFIIDTYQIDEARVMGADAILLIAAILDAPTMRHFYEYATELGLHCLFEAHNEAEMEQVLACGAKICGINNRNLKNFVVDLKTTERLAAMVPKDCILVSESPPETRKLVLQIFKKARRGIHIGSFFVQIMHEKFCAQNFFQLLRHQMTLQLSVNRNRDGAGLLRYNQTERIKFFTHADSCPMAGAKLFG